MIPMNDAPKGLSPRVRGWIITTVTAAFFVVAVYAFQRIQGQDESPREGGGASSLGGASAASDGPDGGPSLRDELLHSTSAQIGVTPLRHVWGVLMERGYKKGVATVVALADGTASMYISAGGAVTGAKAYGPARLAATRLCEQAADALGDLIPAVEYPAPAKGRVRFYVLTDGGVRTAEGNIAGGAKDGGPDKLGPLDEAGDALLEALRDATSKGFIR
ncbi:MAG: hypothetical protein JWM82_947 [Myxococcales bacterium]|nr:hypothetical protein [Myxococcales bacterium]